MKNKWIALSVALAAWCGASAAQAVAASSSDDEVMTCCRMIQKKKKQAKAKSAVVAKRKAKKPASKRVAKRKFKKSQAVVQSSAVITTVGSTPSSGLYPLSGNTESVTMSNAAPKSLTQESGTQMAAFSTAPSSPEYIKPSAATMSTTKTLEDDGQASILKGLHLSYFGEFMGPAFMNNPSAVPNDYGAQMDPINLYNDFKLSIDLSKDTQLFWKQGVPLNMGRNESYQGGTDATFLDPRLGVRLKNNFEGWAYSHIDFFVIPGWTRGAGDARRWGSTGTRLDWGYTPQGSRITFGNQIDIIASFYRGSGGGSRAVHGHIQPSVNYKITDSITWVTTPTWNYQFLRPQAAESMGRSELFMFGGMRPFIQNGLNFQLTSNLAVAGLVNNYLSRPPSGENTWFSIWLDLTIL